MTLLQECHGQKLAGRFIDTVPGQYVIKKENSHVPEEA